MKMYRLFMVCIFFLVFTSQASTTLGSTRVIYPAKEREITLTLHNPATDATLVQAWVDRGDIHATPDDANVPFLVMPPLIRINAGQGAALRVMFTQNEQLPQDRESVFWLNIMDIPPLLKENKNNYVELAYRSRIKLFYRPAGLTGDVGQAARKVTWKASRSENGKNELTGCNNSEFHVSFNRVMMTLNKIHYINDQGGMIAPAECRVFHFTLSDKVSTDGNRIEAEWIDDYGEIHQQRGLLTQ